MNPRPAIVSGTRSTTVSAGVPAGPVVAAGKLGDDEQRQNKQPRDTAHILYGAIRAAPGVCFRSAVGQWNIHPFQEDR